MGRQGAFQSVWVTVAAVTHTDWSHIQLVAKESVSKCDKTIRAATILRIVGQFFGDVMSRTMTLAGAGFDAVSESFDD